MALASLCAPAAGAAAPAPRHAVIIVVDGLRPDAITATNARNIQALAARGARTTARVVELPKTLPSLATLVTGLPPSAHGVTWNDDRGREPSAATIFTQVHDAGGRTALYVGKSKLAVLAPRNSADVRFGPSRNAHAERGLVEAVAARFAADFARERPALAFVHLREPDTAGHAHGWMGREYLAAVRAADAAVGVVLGAIDASGLARSTAIYLTADHGGEGTTHGPDLTEVSWLVPFICVVPGRPARRIEGAVTMVDVAPTVLAWLRLPPLPGAQGKPVAACL